jgi:hypothetical protein
MDSYIARRNALAQPKEVKNRVIQVISRTAIINY